MTSLFSTTIGYLLGAVVKITSVVFADALVVKLRVILQEQLIVYVLTILHSVITL
jgi:hypothetical protein